MRIRTRLWLNYGIFILLLAAAALVALQGAQKAKILQKETAFKESQFLALTTFRASTRNYILKTSDSLLTHRSRTEQDLLLAEEDAAQRLEQLERSFQDQSGSLPEETRTLLNRLNTVFQELDHSLQRVQLLSRAGREAAARSALNEALHSVFESRFLPLIRALINDEVSGIQLMPMRLSDAIRYRTWQMIALLLLAALLTFLLTARESRFLGQRLAKLERETKKIAGGDFDVCVPLEGHDELATLAGSFNSMAAQLKQAQAALAAQQARMIQASKMAALGEMAGGVAHEINNPLTILKSGSSVLLRLSEAENPDREALIRTAAKLDRTVDRIATIVKGLRTFSRDGSHDPIRNVELAQLIRDTIPFCMERFKSHGIELQVDPIPTDVEIPCRPTELSQVLLNLLNNAHDAVERLPVRWVRISWRKDGSNIELSITDSGSGVPPGFRERLFQPFFTTKDIGKGTGLGLSVSAGIIASHGGELWYDVQSPHTRFVITLPGTSESGQSIKA